MTPSPFSACILAGDIPDEKLAVLGKTPSSQAWSASEPHACAPMSMFLKMSLGLCQEGSCLSSFLGMG